MEDSEDQLFVYHSELELPRVAEDVTYKCKATLEVEEEVFVHERVAIAISGPKCKFPRRSTLFSDFEIGP